MCGTEFARGANFCTKCGLSVSEYEKKLKKLAKSESKPPPPNRQEHPPEKSFEEIGVEMFETGRRFESIGDYADAVINYTLSINLGNVSAMMALARLYEMGRGVPKSFELAFGYYEKAAKAGDLKAMLRLGSWYENGRGTKQNYVHAMRWYKKASQLDDSGEAVHRLGLMYMFGRGTAKNDYLATQCFIKGAKKGNLRSIAMVGVAYHFGGGVERDLGKALICYKALAECGNPSLAEFGRTHIDWINTGVRPIPANRRLDNEQSRGRSLLETLRMNNITIETTRLVIELLSMFGS